ncbi:MAG: hypothetical protein CVU18_21025 [Betaproteobacteria bacterium HGW-Betaproteobacteria-12]|nr:MAG: hypothetical protein CVU18_21025 [Betaproteobacteria bacterium HGW-Betaproteobacteria-12]
MREVFSSSIGNLQATVLSSVLADSQFLAALAIDIMDRNLYERANDCRWWALDATIRRLMDMSLDDKRQSGLETVIRYINSLYTVYDNIVLFDTAGQVCAVSNPAYGELVGSRLDEPWVAACLELSDSQSYTVSGFTRTGLYAGRPTYVYLAALRSADDNRVTGGIAIVFDAEPQFPAMLRDALPREASGEAVADSFAVYVDGQSTIIASSHSAYPVGSTLALPDELLNPPAAGCSRLINLNDQVMAAGARRSAGYREYKGAEDDYRNNVTAVVFVPLGSYRPEADLCCTAGDVASRRSVIPAGISSREIATFHLAGHWLGLPVSDVVEAIEANGATRLPNAPKEIYGALIHGNASLPIYNLHAALGLGEPADSGSGRQIVVVRGENEVDFGILVDTLGEILEVPSADIEDLSNIYVGVASVLASVVKTTPQNGGGMLVLLSVGSMSQHLHGQPMPATLGD